MIIFGENCGHKIEYFGVDKPKFCPTCGKPTELSATSNLQNNASVAPQTKPESTLDVSIKADDDYEESNDIPNGLEGVFIDTSDMGGQKERTNNNNSRVRGGLKFGQVAATSSAKIQGRSNGKNMQKADKNFFKEFSKSAGPVQRSEVNYQDVNN